MDITLADNQQTLVYNKTIVPISESKKQWLKKYNLVAGCLHLVQALMQLLCGVTVDNFKNFKLPIRINYLKSYDTPDGSSYLDVGFDEWGTMPLAPFISMFFFLSAFAHFYTLYNVETYFENLSRGINPYRWWEYAFSSSLMIWLIAQLFGIYDIASLINIFFSNFATQLCGLLMEQVNDLQKPGAPLNWMPFYVGCITGFTPWLVTCFYFFGSGPSNEIPSFVYAVFFSYFVFFNTFPINMVLQYKKISFWKDYIWGEQCYILLSLFSKTLLGWLVFGGVNQPNKYT